MNKLPFDINEVKWQDFGEGIKSAVWKPDERCCVQYWEIQPGIGAAAHNHEAEQITYVQTGLMDLYIEDKCYHMTPGCFARIPSNVTHRTVNVGQTVVVNIDFFMPDRDDRIESEKIADLGHHWE